MQEKTVQIHFRATEKERLQFQANAQKCGLSLSAYLRKLAIGHKPQALPPIQYGKLVDVLSDSYNLFRWRNNVEAADRILYLVTRLTEIITPKKRGDADGDNQDMAGAG
jgi:hypothetical protein